MGKRSLFFITSKESKFNEAKSVIPSLERKNIDLTEIQSMDTEEIIHHKLEEAKKKIKGSIIVEDAAVYFSALNGFPGPFSKWMMETAGVDRIYLLFSKSGSRGIKYSCVIGLYHNGTEHYFDGSVEGTVVKPRGKNGFHYDTMFKPVGARKTFAEMSLEEKNRYSHRGQAFRKLKEFLDKQ